MDAAAPADVMRPHQHRGVRPREHPTVVPGRHLVVQSEAQRTRALPAERSHSEYGVCRVLSGPRHLLPADRLLAQRTRAKKCPQ